MGPLSVGILIVAILLIIEVVLMLVKIKVDKMLLLMPVIGVIFAAMSFVLNEYRDKILSSLFGYATFVVIYVILAAGVIFGLIGVAVWFWGKKGAKGLVSGLGNIVARDTKCPNCGAEVRKEDKFCGECGKPLRREIEIAPKWKWGSMIASLLLIFIWLFVYGFLWGVYTIVAYTMVYYQFFPLS